MRQEREDIFIKIQGLKEEAGKRKLAEVQRVYTLAGIGSCPLLTAAVVGVEKLGKPRMVMKAVNRLGAVHYTRHHHLYRDRLSIAFAWCLR